MKAAVESCPGCGWRVEGGGDGCRARYEALLARDYGDPLFFSVHRLFVDIYSLQHPDDYCQSGKSLAAHLTGLCLILEEGASAATGAAFLKRWLDGPHLIDKPPLPTNRGDTTLGDLARIEEPSVWRQSMRRWADSTWDAYQDLQPLARRWAAAARSTRR